MRIHPSDTRADRRHPIVDVEAARLREMLLVEAPPLPPLALGARRTPVPAGIGSVAVGALVALGATGYEWLVTPAGHQIWYPAYAWVVAWGAVWFHDPARMGLALLAGAAGLAITGLSASRLPLRPQRPVDGGLASG